MENRHIYSVSLIKKNLLRIAPCLFNGSTTVSSKIIKRCGDQATSFNLILEANIEIV